MAGYRRTSRRTLSSLFKKIGEVENQEAQAKREIRNDLLQQIQGTDRSHPGPRVRMVDSAGAPFQELHTEDRSRRPWPAFSPRFRCGLTDQFKGDGRGLVPFLGSCPTDGAAKRPAADDQPLAELRAILLGPDRAAWDHAPAPGKIPRGAPKTLPAVLAEAVRCAPMPSSDARCSHFSRKLPALVQSNPRMLARPRNFRFSAKPFARLSLPELDGMLQSLSQTLEQRFSWRSCRWRWGVHPTGKPYADDCSPAKPLYRVEQVFLIHRKTGLLLQYVAANRRRKQRTRKWFRGC